MRLVQRTGRIDRLTSKFDTIHSRACFPDAELDGILKLVGKLLGKIETINETVGLDTGLLGTTPAPKQFNGSSIKRIRKLQSGRGADGTIEELERESDIMPGTSPINELSKHIKDMGVEAMKDIPFGRRIGKDWYKTVCDISVCRKTRTQGVLCNLRLQERYCIRGRR